MSLSRPDLIEIVFDSLKAIVPDVSSEINEDTFLWGPKGSLNSIQLVHFIVELETEIESRITGKKIVLLSDRALSRDKSPFLTVRNLVDFILEFH